MAKALILKDLIDKLGISTAKFERKIEVTASSIAKAIERNSEIKDYTIEKILATYPQVSRTWLETGAGSMFVPEKPKIKVPLIGDAAAGTEMEMNVSDHSQEMEYIDVGDMLRDSEAAFTVYGNSMSPNYPSGCILGIRRNTDNFIQPGEIYLLLTRSNRVFKRLYYNDDRTGFICHSDNTMEHEKGQMKGKPYYPPFEVKETDVVTVYDVVGMIKRTRNSGVIMRQN